ncbi:hypothetical protein IGI04_036145 [Brassica rapa subsp. trilocularis]|uniref:Uncharacterized protein n=1 Tax=Brassica rapa subsp. trilocularis TaxID=1813537 RepID=A0ABQ7LDN8_BRACM|nr:hypothetical protein IGI04_036145 [Brassica rapa subsp. trilocularis]
MGSEEDDETFVRRNRLLQEAITKQVMEAMVKLLEEKYDQRPHDGQGQASGSRHEQRRNRQGQREHAGSEETDNFYERSSHSSGSRRSRVKWRIRPRVYGYLSLNLAWISRQVLVRH